MQPEKQIWMDLKEIAHLKALSRFFFYWLDWCKRNSAYLLSRLFFWPKSESLSANVELLWIVFILVSACSLLKTNRSLFLLFTWRECFFCCIQDFICLCNKWLLGLLFILLNGSDWLHLEPPSLWLLFVFAPAVPSVVWQVILSTLSRLLHLCSSL